eukprot:4991504-Pyramimonas_sp.AAC.3
MPNPESCKVASGATSDLLGVAAVVLVVASDDKVAILIHSAIVGARVAALLKLCHQADGTCPAPVPPEPPNYSNVQNFRCSHSHNGTGRNPSFPQPDVVAGHAPKWHKSVLCTCVCFAAKGKRNASEVAIGRKQGRILGLDTDVTPLLRRSTTEQFNSRPKIFTDSDKVPVLKVVH